MTTVDQKSPDLPQELPGKGMPSDKVSLGMRTEGRAGISAREDGRGEEKVSPGSGTLCDHAWCGGSDSRSPS